jgi:hypothetical protein
MITCGDKSVTPLVAGDEIEHQTTADAVKSALVVGNGAVIQRADRIHNISYASS